MIIKIIEAIFCIGFIIFIHELGHLIAAHAIGIRIQRFSVFLSPFVSIIRWKPNRYLKFMVSSKKGSILEGENKKEDLNNFEKINPKSWLDTEYVLGWIPIAGYCLPDTKFDNEESENTTKFNPNWDIRNAGPWKRLCFSLAGVAANIIVAFTLFFICEFFEPKADIKSIESDNTFISYSPIAKKIGIKDDDIILKADSTDIRDPFIDMNKIFNAKEVTIKRGQEEVKIKIPAHFKDSILAEVNRKEFNYYLAYYPEIPLVSSVVNGSIADSLGIKKGDYIVSLDSIPLLSTSHFLYLGISRIGRKTFCTFARANKNGDFNYFSHSFVFPRKYPPVGMKLAMTNDEYIQTVQYLVDSIRTEKSSFETAIKETNECIKYSVPFYMSGKENQSEISTKQTKTDTNEEDDKYSGIAGIINILPNQFNWFHLIYITAVLSISIAILNLLPIPGLDGSHALICVLEIILRRKIDNHILDLINAISLLLILGLIIWDNAKGIIRFIFD